jgi:hypothetical protein
MAGLVPAIHVLLPGATVKTWMPATSAGMTQKPIARYFTFSSSTSKISVAFGGMTPAAPRAP